MKLTVLIWVVFCCGGSFADPLLPKTRYQNALRLEEPHPERYFFKPTPFQPTQGLMLATLFEPGFILASASPGIDGLLILGDEEVVANARANAQLLFMQNFAEFSRMRVRGDVVSETFAMDNGIEHEDMQNYLLTSKRTNLRYRTLEPKMKYWIHENGFNKLQKMAREQRIVAQPISFFSSGAPMRDLVEELHAHGEKISAVLLGMGVAALMYEEGDQEGVRRLRAFLETLKPVLSADAVALYVHPVDVSRDPYYENVPIAHLLRADDAKLIRFFSDPCVTIIDPRATE